MPKQETTGKIIFAPDKSGHFVPQFVLDLLPNIGKPKNDRSKSTSGEGLVQSTTLKAKPTVKTR